MINVENFSLFYSSIINFAQSTYNPAAITMKNNYVHDNSVSLIIKLTKSIHITVWYTHEYKGKLISAKKVRMLMKYITYTAS